MLVPKLLILLYMYSVHAHRVSLQQHSKAWVQILLLRLVSLVHIYVRGPLGSSELNARNRWL
jgi:hypothetical protein